MEKIIKKFDEIMVQYNEEYTSTDDPNKQLKINEKYEKIISDAEQEMEKKLEEFNKLEDERLLKEQKESDMILDTEVDNITAEINFLRKEKYTAKQIANRYNKTNNNKNGFSTTELYNHFGGIGTPKEILMAEFVYKKINDGT